MQEAAIFLWERDHRRRTGVPVADPPADTPAFTQSVSARDTA
jgi:hypothetical protein